MKVHTPMIDVILQSAIFDVAYYTCQACQTFQNTEDAVEHYLTDGWKKHINPHPIFNTKYYLEKNPDIANAQMNPLIHYILHGAFESRNPSKFFDSHYYLQENKDVAATKVNPLSHYLSKGGFEGRKPNPLFDSSFYITTYADVAKSNINPLVHYVLTGENEGRKQNNKIVFSQELYLAMRALEPLLPSYEELPLMRELQESFVSNAGTAYDKLRGLITQPFTHLFLAENHQELLRVESWIASFNTGGQEYMPLVVLTGKGKSSTKSEGKNLLGNTINLNDLQKGLSLEDKIAIVCKLAIQGEPHVIHIFDSVAGYKLIQRFSRPLSLKSKLFASASSYTKDDEQIPSGCNLLLTPCLESLSAVFVETEGVRQEIINQIGIDKTLATKLQCTEKNANLQNSLTDLNYFRS